MREELKKTKWNFLMAFAIERRPPSLMALISIHFYPTFFQLNLTYMKAQTMCKTRFDSQGMILDGF